MVFFKYNIFIIKIYLSWNATYWAKVLGHNFHFLLLDNRGFRVQSVEMFPVGRAHHPDRESLPHPPHLEIRWTKTFLKINFRKTNLTFYIIIRDTFLKYGDILQIKKGKYFLATSNLIPFCTFSIRESNQRPLGWETTRQLLLTKNKTYFLNLQLFLS